MLCPICNRTIASGDFCDDLQCPNPTRDGAEGAGRQSASLLRGWAKAYRDTPEHRFPSDPNAEFFPVDLECAADLLSAPPKPAPDALLTRAECDWPANQVFTFRDDPGEHDPCYVVMPGGAMLVVNHHAAEGVDIARAKFIVDACNAAIAAPVPPADGALEAARQEVVMAIAFLGRDSGTDRLQATVDGLIPGLAKADAILRSFCSPLGTGAAEPVAWIVLSEHLDDLGYEKSRIWWRDKKSADAWCRDHNVAPVALYVTPPVRGDRETLDQLYETTIQHMIDQWTADVLERKFASSWHYGELWKNIRAAILSLHVQPGAGEREMPSDLSDGLPHLNRNE